VGSLSRGAGNDVVLTVKNTGTLTIASIAFSPPSRGFSLSAPRPSSCVTQPDDVEDDLPGNVICGSGGIGAPPTNLIPPGGTFTVTVATRPRYPDGAGGNLFYTTNDDGVLESSDVAVTGPTAPVPVVGRLVAAAPLKGRVSVSLPAVRAQASSLFSAWPSATSPSVPGLKGRTFVALRAAGQIPVRSFVDTRKGTVKLTSARSARGGTLTADFAGGVFQVLQSSKARARGLTELQLKGASFKSCRKSSRSVASGVGVQQAARRRIRRLRGRGRGRFRVRGRYSSATVRGTDWTVTDRCDGTLTTVKSGRVAVRDFRRKKTVTVRAGKRYLARARR
jgi:hypothetical protein